MTCDAISVRGKKYVFVTGGEINTEQDALDLLSACYEHETTLIMLPFECLSDAYLDLFTRLAGLFLQKLTNYGVKTAAIIDPGRLFERFKELSYESAKGNSFRVFGCIEDAEEWLIV